MITPVAASIFFFFNDTATTEIYTLSLHDALPILIPFESYMIPFYLQIKALGWVNTYAGIAAPLLIMSFGIFFMRQSIMTIPDELLDAARIDGASEFYIYRRGVLPLSQPAPGALAILAVQKAWGFFILPMIVTSDPRRFTPALWPATF